MPNELIATLIKFLPTIFFGLIVLGAIFGGFLKGFRKSAVLFVHYILALAVGFVAYFVLSKKALTMDLNFLFSLIGGDYSNAHTVYDFVRILMEQTSLAAYSSVAGNYYIQGVIDAFAGLAVNLILGIVCLIVLPLILRFIFRLFYFLFYSERKYKKHRLAEGEEYHRHRFLGMGVGLLRGVVCATLAVSFLSSIFFIVAGGDYYEKDETKEIQLFDYLVSGSDVDINAYYNALKQSRNTGIGVVFDKIKIKEKPIDYFYTDLYLSSSFKTYDHGSKDDVVTLNQYLNAELENNAMATLSIRSELALLVGLVEGLLECNAITIVDGAVKTNNEALLKEVPKLTGNYVSESVFFSDILPLAIIGMVQEIQEGDISIQPDIDKYMIENDVYSKVRKVNLGSDLSNMLTAFVPLVEILEVNPDTGQIDFNSYKDPNKLLSLSAETIESVFKNLSEITILTEVIFPIGMGIAFNSFQTQLTEAGISTDDIDLSIINWKKELANLGKIYRSIASLELDFAKLIDQTIVASGKTAQMEYLTNYVKEETNKTKLLNVVDTVMDSDLTSQFALVMVKKVVTDIKVTNPDGTENELNASLQSVKDNLNARDENGNLIYSRTHLKADLHTFVESCLGLFDLFSVFSGDKSDQIALMKQIPVDTLRTALLGDKYSEDGTLGGIYSIKFLSGDLDGDGIVDSSMKAATDDMLETLLKSYAKEVFKPEDIDAIESWPEELDALISCIEVLQGDEFTDLSFDDPMKIKLADDAVDKLTASCSRSILVGNLISTKIKDALGEQDTISIPENTEWLDTIDEETDVVVARGELNKMLKILNVLNGSNTVVDFNNSDTLINRLSELTTDEVDTLTDSIVLTQSLNGIVRDMLYPDDETKELPSDVTWANTYEDGTLVKTGELQTFIDILNIKALKTETTKEDGTVETKFDAEKLTDVDTIAQLIKTENTPDKYNDAEAIAKSQIVMSVISDKISGISSDEVDIVIPDTLKGSDNWQAWSHQQGVYQDGEFIKMVYSLHCARNYVITIKDENNNLKYPKLTTENLIEGILGMPENEEDYSPITESLVMYATLSNKLDSLSKEENPTIQIRSEAYVKEEELMANNNIAIYKEEVSLALCTIGELGITDFNNVNTSTIIDNIRTNLDVRRNLCNSNIMNKTIVDKLISNSSGTLKFPVKDSIDYSSKDASAWYPTEAENSWETCELNLVLDSIVELSSGDDAGIIIEGDNISSNTNKLFKDLSNPAINTKDKSKLEVIYASEVMAFNISDKIKEQETNETIEIRDEAFINNDRNNNLEYDEVELLVKFLNDSGFKIDNSDTETEGKELNAQGLLDLVGEDENRSTICHSNILNVTVVTKVTSSSDAIKVPTSMEESRWYPTEVVDSWIDCELNKLLIAINELSHGEDAGITVDGDNISSNTNKLFKDLSNTPISASGETKLEVIYASEVMAFNISDKIKEQETNETIEIRDEAFIEKDPNNNLEYDEIKLLVTFLNENEFKIDSTDKEAEGKEINAKELLDLVSEDENRSTICHSNILNITVISKITSSGDTIKIPNELKKDNDWDLEDSDWYPTEVVDSWKECELNKLLISVDLLGIKTDENDKNKVIVDTENIVYDLNVQVGSNKKIEIVYQSLVMAQTISDYIISDSGLDIPKEYKTNVSDTEATKVIDDVTGRITSGEITSLVNSIDILQINVGSEDVSGKVKPDKLTADYIISKDSEKIEELFTSAIISYKTSTILIDNVTVIVPNISQFKLEVNGIIEGKDGVYSDEISSLLIAVKVMEFEVDEPTTFSLGSVDINKLEAQLDNSKIFHATMSKQITNNVDYVPSYYYKDINTEVKLIADIDPVLDKEELFVNKEEISNIVAVLKTLGIDNAEEASNEINQTFITGLDSTESKVLANSGIIAAMVTNQMTSISLANTKHIYHEVSMYQTKDDSNKVINGDEITALVNAINALGIKDFSNVNSGFLSGEGTGEHITVTQLLNTEDGNTESNIKIVLKSKTIHAMLSENLIDQTQTIGVNEYHIVTYNYKKSHDPNVENDEVTVTTKNVTYKEENGNMVIDVDDRVDTNGAVVKLIEAREIENLLQGVSALGVDEVSQVATKIDGDALIDISKDSNKIALVEKSAILSTIMSNLLLHSERFAIVENELQGYPHYEEFCAAKDDHVDILAFEDIHDALEVVASLSSLLG